MRGGRGKGIGKKKLRLFLREIETENIAAIQLGGYGVWMFTYEVIEVLEKKAVCGRLDLGTDRVARILQEFSFPRTTVKGYIKVMT